MKFEITIKGEDDGVDAGRVEMLYSARDVTELLGGKVLQETPQTGGKNKLQ